MTPDESDDLISHNAPNPNNKPKLQPDEPDVVTHENAASAGPHDGEGVTININTKE